MANYLLWELVCLKHLGMDFLAMTADQPLTTGTCLKLEDALVQEGDPMLRCVVSTGHPHPTVPVTWCNRTFKVVHSLSHPGVWASVKLDRWTDRQTDGGWADGRMDRQTL